VAVKVPGTMGADAQTRNRAAGEHLVLLRSLARELERAIEAIAHNNLAELEESIATQQDLSVRLTELAHNRREAGTQPPSAHNIDLDLRGEIQTAAGELQKLNLRYSLLIEHSSRSAAQMAALFRSFRGQIQEASGARENHSTLSCQV
jgi:flagellar biosynthesis/type III secretory pathway chaperone